MANLSLVESIFFAALAKATAGEQTAYLDKACGSDGDLRRRVERLLNASPKVGGFLEAPAAALATTIDEPIAARPGSVIGPYQLLEQIGEGGFGIVFLAQQQPVRRKVAVKVLKPGMDSRQVIARFEAERQALALMDHPNIARVLDAGETASGRPYFVMELVRGVPITDYCDHNRVPPRQRLELFVPVCQAVQHAHQKGIIHRDIKPSNVLVTLHEGSPVVKVIDFGVAKALGQQLTDKTLFTSFAQLLGTPLYMSPEQAGLGELDVDTRSDVYSLGVLLYEMLSGTTPFDKRRLQGASYDEIRRIIHEEEPPKPSTRISTLGQAATTVSAKRQSDPKRLSQLLRGELDWMVMKALEKDRTRRYETASAFAQDVQHYLRDEPVAACPPSAWYRFGKFGRRHKAALTVAACLVLMVTSLAGFGWIARDQAAREMALDAQVNRALDDAEALIANAKWPEGSEAVKRAAKLLEAAGRTEFSPRLAELHKDLGMARRLEEIHSHPKKEDIFTGHELAAEYLRAFQDYGIDLAVLSVAEAAERIQARSIRLELARGLDFWSAMRRRAGNPGPPDWQWLLEVAKAADPDLWRIQLRNALQRGDRSTLEALAASADIPRLPPDTLHLLGTALNDVGNPEQAVAFLRQARRIRETCG
jgi:serine/threonine protein kinase